MKLYYHPASTTSRPVMMYIGETGTEMEMEIVDLFTGANYGAPYTAINPNQLVPVLDDGDFRLTECSAILKYLAEKSGSSLYPTALQARARVNERMDWVNTQMRREMNYGLVYPQVFDHHKMESAEGQAEKLRRAKIQSQRFMAVLNDHIIGPNPYLCGDHLTIADFFGGSIVAMAELFGGDLKKLPNVHGWLARLKGLKSWAPTFATIEGFAASVRNPAMVVL